MSGLMCRATVVAGAAVVLLGPALGTASAAAGAVAGTGLAAGARAVSGGSWGTAEEVPGTAALNTGGGAGVASVSCAAAGSCSAGGDYATGPRFEQAYVVSQVHGTWGKAEEVPGTATLNTGRFDQFSSVSCATAGNCSAGGYYTDSADHAQAYVVSQVHGTWDKAEEVPGTATLNTGGGGIVYAVSCATAGNCGAGGSYRDSAGIEQVFVVSQVNGTWDKAEQVPGTATLNTGGGIFITSLSCGTAGNCSAGGYYYLHNFRHSQAFVVSQVNGTWSKAKEVPGTATLNQGGNAAVNSISCATASNCSAGGNYTNSAGHAQAFIVSQVHGTWDKAEEVPGTATLNQGGNAAINSISCATASSCSAGGDYTNGSRRGQAFVVSQVNGTWDKAEEVPGTATLNTSGSAQVNSVSCATAGNCSAGGNYASRSGAQAFVVNQVNGTWSKAEEVPGTATLNAKGSAGVTSVSCAAAGYCGAGGNYFDSSRHTQAFVVSKP